MATLYMMFGYPGAGKTTAAAQIAELTGAKHLSSDATRLELFPNPQFTKTEHDALYAALDMRTEELLTLGHDVIYDANLNRWQHRKDKYDICDRTGATPVLLWIQTAKELAKRRATDESRQQLQPPGETLAQLFDRVADVIEEPGPAEPYVALDGTKISAEYISDLLDLKQ